MSFDEFRQLVIRLKLLEPAQLEDCLSRLDPTVKPTAETLLRMMASRNYLTSFQVSRIENGETDGLLLGDYKLLYRNASGSFARVYRASSIKTGEMVGIKVLRQRWAKDSDMVLQFHREAGLCRKLRHKNIVPIYDIGRQGNIHYFSMEFVAGGNLRELLNIRKKLSPLEATRCMLDICEGLGYAYSKGITHRDMKMTNVLMSSGGVAKLVDFGLAGDQAISGRGDGDGVQRALEYATLEQYTEAPINDPRSDLFFAGAIYYELLTGVPPYARTRSREERKQIARYQSVRPIEQVNAKLPRNIVSIVDKLLQFEPSLRYQNPIEAIRDLRSALPQLEQMAKQTLNGSSHGQNGEVEEDLSLRTLLCIESRKKQQDVLRDYFSKKGFRVLILSDVGRALKRIEDNPPDCLLLMGESIGDTIVGAYDKIMKSQNGKHIVTFSLLAERQSDLLPKMEQTENSSILIQPLTLRELRREMHVAIQRKMHQLK